MAASVLTRVQPLEQQRRGRVQQDLCKIVEGSMGRAGRGPIQGSSSRAGVQASSVQAGEMA